jgi:hypothetical protein
MGFYFVQYFRQDKSFSLFQVLYVSICDSFSVLLFLNIVDFSTA